LTAYHVVKDGKKYQIITPDKKINQINSVKPLSKADLAVVEFSSNNTYKFAKIGNSDRATASTTVYVTGFPVQRGAIPNPTLFFNKGQVQANGAAQRDGYNIIYDNDTLAGMSGGPVLNEQGEVVAIHGRADEQIINDKSQTKIITGLGITIYSALGQMLAAGVDVGVRSPDVVAAAPKADDFFIKAKEKQEKQDYEGAIADVNQAIRLNPNYAEAYKLRGSIRIFPLKDKQGAISDFNQAIKINPKDAEAYVSRGQARGMLPGSEKTPDRAERDQVIKISQEEIADYSLAIKVNPNYAEAYIVRGHAHSSLAIIRSTSKNVPFTFNSEEKQAAIANFTQVIKLNPSDAEAYAGRGASRYKLGDKQGALEDLTQALKINPKYAEAYTNRGGIRAESGDTKGALEDLNQAIKINPNDASAYNNRGAARHFSGDKQGAIEDFSQAIGINPNYADAYKNRGNIRAESGDKYNGVKDLQKAAELFQQQGNNESYKKTLELIIKYQS
jgi:tetratricopeptide (TPR) repeat protein